MRRRSLLTASAFGALALVSTLGSQPALADDFSYAINGAAYRGAYATGGSMMYRLNTSNPMAVGVGFSQGGGKNRAVRIGIAGEF